jgi:uncharacterized protein DUF5763
MPIKRSKPTLAQCKATTSSGARCKAKPHKEGLCFFLPTPRERQSWAEREADAIGTFTRHRCNRSRLPNRPVNSWVASSSAES